MFVLLNIVLYCELLYMGLKPVKVHNKSSLHFKYELHY